MKEIWRLWLGLWLGLPDMERKSSTLWDMQTKTKTEYENIQKNTDIKKTGIDTQNGFLKRQKEIALEEQEKKQYAKIQPHIVWNSKKEGHMAEQITTLQQKHHQPIQTTLRNMEEPYEQKERLLFSMMSKQEPKQQEKKAITQMGALPQEKTVEKNTENKQNGKMLPPFLHTTTHQNIREQMQQQKQPSAIWKQQGEDVVMLQKILRHYENQQNGAMGNQNVSIQIGHIKQQADVDDVMEALTKKLWEARSMTTKKAKGGVSHG